MLQDAHTMKFNDTVVAPVGTTTVIPATADRWIYVHELIGDLEASGTLEVRQGTDVVGTFRLDAGQGITLQDIPGETNRPRFSCRPGQPFVLFVTGGTFNGAITYSFRY